MQFVFGRHAEFRSPHVLTIGNFDGVHVGHQRVIQQAQQVAKQLQLPLTVLLFEPQPKEYFADRIGQVAPARLMNLKTKVTALSALGVDCTWCLKFSDIRPMSAETFVSQLVAAKQVRHLVVGDDFRFGCDRQGDYNYLVAAGERSGFTVEQSDTHRVGDERVSSSRIRDLLKTHDFDGASQLLGRQYALCGRVCYGQQLGRKIGFPTANIALPTHRRCMACLVARLSFQKDGSLQGSPTSVHAQPSLAKRSAWKCICTSLLGSCMVAP